MPNSDLLMRFMFDHHPVRGELVRLDRSVKELLRGHDYPEQVKGLLLDLSCAAALCATSFKDGSETMLQLKGESGAPLRYALVNIRADLSFYGSAALEQGAQPAPGGAPLLSLCGAQGILALTVFPAEGERWQGLVQTDPDSVQNTLEHYFLRSAQLPTSFVLLHDPQCECAAGLLLQVLPDEQNAALSLEHLTVLARSLTGQEALKLPFEEILQRLYAHESVRVFDPLPLTFRCNCSAERCLTALSKLTPGELGELINDGGTSMTCQHCGRSYQISAAQLQALLKESS